VDGDLSVVVIGGGIAGLAAAYRLSREMPEARVTLLEATARLGGKIVTEREDGFVVEGGPDSFLASKPRGVGLCQELGLGASLQGVTPQPRRAYVLSRGELHDLPEGLSGLVPTRLAPLVRSRLLSPAGKARVALDYLLPASRAIGDESLGAFIRRRLGAEAWERLVEPLMAGIYAADGDRLSLAATFPQLRQAEREHGGLIRGVLAGRRATATEPAAPSAFLTPESGLDLLVTALAGQLRERGARVRLEAPVASIARERESYHVRLADGATLPTDAVILATPAFVAADLLAGLDGALAADLAAIPHASSAIVSLAYRREDIPHPLDAHGYVVPRVEQSPILACTWSSRKWRHRAPEGWELLRVFIGRAGRGEEEIRGADDDRLVAMARAEVAARLGERAAPGLVRVQRWPRGIPQYLLGHPERVARIDAALRAQPGLFVAGNAYRGVGVPDCIASGEGAAEAAREYLRAVAAAAGEGCREAMPPVRRAAASHM
jgi:oxygen-dependent protoporphyrinogen oxidase